MKFIIYCHIAGGSSVPGNLVELLQDSFLAASKSSFGLLKECISLLVAGRPSETDPNTYIRLDETRLREVIGVALETLKKGSLSSFHHANFVNDPVYSTLLLGLIDIIGEAIRVRVADKNFTDNLRSFGLSKDTITLLLQTLTENRVELELAVREQRAILPSISALDWRVDVTITTTQLNKVFKPSILMQLTTTDDQMQTFECSVEKFHQLRYSVARMIAAMQTIEHHPTLMRLVD